MTDRSTIMMASMKALMTMLEDEAEWEGRTAKILYSAFTSFDEDLVRSNCDTATGLGYDGVLAFFDPVGTSPARIGVTLLEGAMIKLQLGRLWMAPRGTKAVLVPHGVGRVHGHYAVADGRIVQRKGWPAETLERGTRRAEARYAGLVEDNIRTIEIA